MRNNLKITIFFLLLASLQLSCSKENKTQNEVDSTVEQKGVELSDFAVLLSKAVYNDAQLRSFIKSESIRQFDKDYDVFYPLVKDRIIYDGLTFRDILIYYDSDNKLDAIEKEEPLLNILVPDWSWVDESCFSPNNWDTTSQEVVVTFENSDDSVPLFGNGEFLGTIQGNIIPSGPVLVVKRNERMVYNPTKSSIDAYAFVDEEFDGCTNIETRGTVYEHDYEFSTSQPDDEVLTLGLSPKIRQAYSESVKDYHLPQRDHIYYDMTSDKNTGVLDFHYSERLLRFRFTDGNIPGLYDDTVVGNDMNLVSNESPGKALTDEELKQMIWCEGNLEVVFHVMAGSREYRRTKSFQFKDAFSVSEVHFEWFQNFFRTVTWRYYEIDPMTLVPKWISLNWKLFTWDLTQFPTAYCVWAEEVDSGASITRSHQCSFKYANNFSQSTTVEAGINNTITLKMGFGTGESLESTNQESITIATKEENDDLGQTWVQYTDPVITHINGKTTEIYRYSTGSFDFLIVPQQDF